jgi:short-subunit dehydrogenase
LPLDTQPRRVSSRFSYTASKHAAESFTSALRSELRGWGIDVSTCNPSFHRTPLQASGATMLSATWANASDELRDEYGGDYMERLTKVHSH